LPERMLGLRGEKLGEAIRERVTGAATPHGKKSKKLKGRKKNKKEGLRKKPRSGVIRAVELLLR